MLKAAIKQSSADQIRHRIIPTEAVTGMATRLDELKDEIQEILKEEQEEKLVRLVSLHALTISATPSGYGAQEGSEHGRTRSRNLLQTSQDVVPERKGETGC